MADVAGMTPWTGRCVLVTGATGLVGSWLVRRLLLDGAQVVALVRDLDPQSELVRGGAIREVNVVSGRLESADDVERAIVEHGVDTIFHLGAQTIVGTALRSPRPTLESNVQGTWNVLEAARLHSSLVERVVVASSDKAYGDATKLPYVEAMPLQGMSPYDVSKSCADLITQAYARSYGIPVAIARCGNIYGGGDLNWSRLVPGTLRSLAFGETPVIRSDGTFLRDYIFVDDVVEGYLCLAEALSSPDVEGKAYNFSDESPRTVMEMFDAVCQAVGTSIEPVILGHANNEIHDQYLSSERAREELGWKPSLSLGEGLALTWAWYRDVLTPASRSGS